MTAKNGALSPQDLEAFRTAFEAKPEYRIAMNAASRGDLEEVSLNRRVTERIDWSFSDEIPPGGITAQKMAGTCWLYAGLNWLRKLTARKMGVDSMLFSQNYLVFWDRLEKANVFFEKMIELAGLPLDDRKVHHYLATPANDGGDWLLLANLIDKYGMVPSTAMAESANLGNSAFMNRVISYKLREGAATLRRLHADGKRLEALRARKRELMGDFYRMLCVLFGEPPRSFDFAYRDKKGKFHRDRGLTPKDFFRKWVGIRTGDYRHLVSSPLPDTPFLKTYAFECARNIEGFPPGASLNVPIQTVRELAITLLKKKEPVFFDCDVTLGLNRKLGMFDTELYDYGLLFDTRFDWGRSERMQYLQERPTHCMVMLGVDLVGGKPVKWKIENSWGDDKGDKGVFQMTDRWFEEHVYGIVVSEKVLGKKLTALADQPPTILPPWHTLA